MIVFIWDSECTIHSKVENYKKIINQTSLIKNVILNNKTVEVLVSSKVKDETIVLSIVESLASCGLNLITPVMIDRPMKEVKYMNTNRNKVSIVFIGQDEVCPFIASKPESGDIATLELEMGMWNPVYTN